MPSVAVSDEGCQTSAVPAGRVDAPKELSSAGFTGPLVILSEYF